MINRVIKKLSKEVRDEIIKSFLEGVKDVGEYELTYVEAKLPAVLARLDVSNDPLKNEMADLSKKFYSMLFRDDCSSVERDYVVAALFYLCNPFDVIPDFRVSDGFLDDAYVLFLVRERYVTRM